MRLYLNNWQCPAAVSTVRYNAAAHNMMFQVDDKEKEEKEKDLEIESAVAGGEHGEVMLVNMLSVV